MTKVSFRLFLAAFIFGSLFNACTKQDAAKVINNVISSSMSATIAGMAWSADASNGVSKASLGIVLLSGLQTSGSSIQVTIPAPITPGTIQVGLGTTANVAYNKDKSNIYAATSGSIVITSFQDSVVVGTFSGSVTNATNPNDVVAITDGAFTVKL